MAISVYQILNETRGITHHNSLTYSKVTTYTSPLISRQDIDMELVHDDITDRIRVTHFLLVFIDLESEKYDRTQLRYKMD